MSCCLAFSQHWKLKALLLFMANRPTKSHPGHGGLKASLYPLRADQALAAALRVNPEDVKRLEQLEKRKNGNRATH